MEISKSRISSSLLLTEYEKVAQLLVQRGADIDYVGNYGTTALMTASGMGNEKIARILIEKGANLNARNDNGDSALTISTLSINRENVAWLLIENGADVNIKGYDGRTSLINSARYGKQES